MLRRRQATRDELVAQLAGRLPDVDWSAALDALTEVGASVTPPDVEIKESYWRPRADV